MSTRIKNLTHAWPTSLVPRPPFNTEGLGTRLMAYVHVILSEAHGNHSHRDNERIKAKVLFMHCSLCSYGWRHAISMRALIFLRLTRITSCYAASATRSGVTPLILPAPNTATRFSSRSFNFLQFHPKNTPETILDGQNFPWGGGACPQTPLTGALRVL